MSFGTDSRMFEIGYFAQSGPSTCAQLPLFLQHENIVLSVFVLREPSLHPIDP